MSFLIGLLVALFAIGVFILALFNKEARNEIGHGLAEGSMGCLVVIAVIGLAVSAILALVNLGIALFGEIYQRADAIKLLLICAPTAGLLILILKLAWKKKIKNWFDYWS